MAFTLCEYMVNDPKKVKIVQLTDGTGKTAMRVSATVEGLLTVETNMVLDNTSIVGIDIVAEYRLLADNSKHSGNVKRCSKAKTSGYLPLPAGGTLIAKIVHAGGTLSVTINQSGDCGPD